MKLVLPRFVEEVIIQLESHGFLAYLVGGCVRDGWLNRPCHDYDIATSATPEQVEKIFPRVFLTGATHGTVTVVLEEGMVEVTTFRREGNYLLHRRPKEVFFCSTIEEDLSRRDFTINAMAYHPKKGLLDPYGGMEDGQKKKIKTVGQAKKRYEEDALRMFRGLRFCAQLGFFLEEETKKAMKDMAHTAVFLSGERIYSELTKTLLSPRPEMAWEFWNMGLFAGRTKGQGKIFLSSAQQKILEQENSLEGRMAVLCFHLWQQGELNEAKDLLLLLKAPKKIRIFVDKVAKASQRRPETSKGMKEVLEEFGLEESRLAFLLTQQENVLKMFSLCMEKKECYKIDQLALMGRELGALGFYGKQVFLEQKRLLALCMENPDWNKKETLIALAKEHKKAQNS